MIRAIIVDDEQPSADKIERLLLESGVVDIMGKFTDSLEALDYIKSMPIDVVFLDIEMPEMDGIELSNHMLQYQSKIAVVFVTAYNEYAVEAFRLNALDYLMKPLDKVRLKETLDRIIEEKNINIFSDKLQICCFGEFKVISNNWVVKFRTGKAEELMAFLVDSRGKSAARSAIIDCIWNEFDGDRAVTHFNTTLHYIKKALLQHGSEFPIEHTRGTYRLDIDKTNCDYHKFMSFISENKEINDITILEYEKAIKLYIGEYLKNNEFQWAERSRVLIKEKYIHILLKMAEYYKTARKHSKTVELLIIGLKHEPLHDDINYRLIEALLLTNQRITALKYYDIYKRGLKKEYGFKPQIMFRRLIK